MRCEICNSSMNQFEYDCFNGVCGDCHEKYIKEDAAAEKKNEVENE